ncbi:MAG TPA: phosphoadenylyl-sulfate reductase [Balneolaceae bacterium]|nr:phosphoadenylyl-sulfate reductase [Balneolaceae bacterium]
MNRNPKISFNGNFKADGYQSVESCKNQLTQLNDLFEAKNPDEILKWAAATFGSKIVMGTGFGPSGVFLIHRLYQLGLPISVFYLDTNLLFSETYELCDKLEKQFGITIEKITPEYTLDEQAEKFGDNLWYKNPNRCCFIRKVRPLRNYLQDKSAWITGIRRNQSESRKETQLVEYDSECDVIKINPVAAWSSGQLWSYIKDYDLPYNPLHDESFPSIGCIPCTNQVENGDHERAGRWKDIDKNECGIHLPVQTGT